MKMLVTFILMFTAINLTITASNINYGNIKAKYIKNYDGDTITVNIPDYPPIIGKNISIRVNGIDSPELRSKSVKEKQLARTAKRLVVTFLFISG